jgi:hypothetical protein
MSILTKFISVGYYFTLEYYLREQKLDHNIINYMDNHNIKSNYVCFFDIIKGNNHFLIATNNGEHRLITITNTKETDNHISTQTIIHNGLKLVISNPMSLMKIEKLVNLNIIDTMIYSEKYGDLFFSDQIDDFINYEIFHIYNLRTLSVLTNCKVAHLVNDNAIINKCNIAIIFPNLVKLYQGGRIIYEK